MLSIIKEKCIGCGLCIKDCFPKDIVLVEGKASINNVTCIKCGHCIAVCPKEAVTTNEDSMKDVKNYTKEEFLVDSDNLLNFIKFRRTVRQFTDKKVEEEKLLKIIEAGRFTQTGSNMQDVSYIVVKEQLEDLKILALKSLKAMGEAMLATLPVENKLARRYAEMWTKMHETYLNNPSQNDRLFFNAPAVIVVIANSDVSGALASSNMELMTNALGLGTFFSGFFVRAAQGNKEIMDFLGIKEGKKIVTCMIIGYPNVKYLRTVPRKAANISWK